MNDWIINVKIIHGPIYFVFGKHTLQGYGNTGVPKIRYSINRPQTSKNRKYERGYLGNYRR